MDMDIIFTVCNRYTLANALVLAESVRLYQPGSIFYLCLVDKIEIYPVSTEMHILNVNEIDIPGLDEMCKRYLNFELVAACRPWFGKYICDHKLKHLNTLTFLAPTTMLLNEMSSLPQDIDLLLTPNIASPLVKNSHLDDKRILNVGMFNSGCWTLKKTEATEKFLKWWGERTYDRAKFDLCNGSCMDQLWLNYAPVWVNKTNFSTSGAWHYGLRSVLNHELTFNDQQYFVKGQKLISADFTGLAGFDPVWSDHVKLLSLNEAFKKLYTEYQKRVKGFEPLNGKGSGSGLGIVANISQHRLLKKKVSLTFQSMIDFINEV